MLGIKDKLQQLQVPRAVNSTVRSAQTPEQHWEQIDAAWMENEFGRFLIREKRFNASFTFGDCSVGEFFELPSRAFMEAGGDAAFAAILVEDALFIDAETTGLAGGTGTCGFLFGIGFTCKQELVVRQYFMPDYNSEKAMLVALLKELQIKRCLISFNGKSFDLPLLKTRFIINRLPHPLNELQHIDLLYHVRRLYKSSLPSCSLSQVERSILGVQRHGDIPGSEIPATYFQFLKNREISLIAPILKHNVQDILAMAAILIKSHALFKHGQSDTPHNVRWFFRILCEIGSGEEGLEKLSSSGFPINDDVAIRLKLEQAKFLKTKRQYNRAVAIWTELLSVPQIVVEAYEQLAKYFEHISKEFDQALSVITKLEKRIELRHALRPNDDQTLSPDWRRRRNRLERKLAIHENSAKLKK